MTTNTPASPSGRDATVKDIATLVFALLITAIGFLMMTLTSSPQMKGASMLWLPAALQLMAGVWLGPIRGLIAGGAGAYLAGGFAYGGWGLADIIMNPIAGGLANSLLPGLLFQALKIDPTFGINFQQFQQFGKSTFISISLLFVVLFLGILPLFVNIGQWGYALAGIALVIALPLVMKKSQLKLLSLAPAVVICIISCALSAAIGIVGVHVGGQASWKAAFFGTGLGWFFGDTISSFFGLYMLALHTTRARRAGIARS